MKYYLIVLCFFFCNLLVAAPPERIYIEDISKPLKEKEAILILPGFGSKIQGTLHIADFFFNKGYDIYIPDYISRKSIEKCVTNLDKFIISYKLKEYKKIHVFSYIIGSWTLNTWINNNPINNIATIIYDRSPLQERAPYALVKDVPLLIRIISGKIMKEFSVTKYPTIAKNNLNIGIIIESKATKLLAKHKKSALDVGPVNWDVTNLNQNYTDKFYITLNHDQMYYRFDVSGNEIFYFIKNNKFTETAKRHPYTEDPFINNTD